MQAIFGARNAATINLVIEIIILVGLYIGFCYARKKRFRPHHANVQTTMVLLNLALIISIMVPAFYNYVILGGTTTGTVGTLMIIHAILGTIAEATALYLIAGERTQIIPKPWRIKNIKPVMRATLAVWTITFLLGVGIYYFRWLAPRVETPAAQASTTVILLQYQADTLLIHADELSLAAGSARDPAVRRHTEHVINLLVGNASPDFGDLDKDGSVQDPGDGKGMLNYLQIVHDDAVASNQTQAVQTTDAVREDLLKILADAQAVLRATGYASVAPQLDEIRALSKQVATAGNNSVPQIAQLLNTNTALGAPVPAQVQSGTLTLDMKDFAFQPKALTVKVSSKVVFVNKDNAKHTATGDNNEFNTGDIDAGQTGEITFEQIGTFPYFCAYHGDKGGVDMAGAITVEP